MLSRRLADLHVVKLRARILSTSRHESKQDAGRVLCVRVFRALLASGVFNCRGLHASTTPDEQLYRAHSHDTRAMRLVGRTSNRILTR